MSIFILLSTSNKQYLSLKNHGECYFVGVHVGLKTWKCQSLAVCLFGLCQNSQAFHGQHSTTAGQPIVSSLYTRQGCHNTNSAKQESTLERGQPLEG